MISVAWSPPGRSSVQSIPDQRVADEQVLDDRAPAHRTSR
jgi:hypothetical protein